uniref:BRCA2 n=1 Tax=Caenorhabditis tropicalis TaxID=1561998 RepID=A0A1I7TT43_9PELO
MITEESKYEKELKQALENINPSCRKELSSSMSSPHLSDTLEFEEVQFSQSNKEKCSSNSLKKTEKTKSYQEKDIVLPTYALKGFGKDMGTDFEKVMICRALVTLEKSPITSVNNSSKRTEARMSFQRSSPLITVPVQFQKLNASLCTHHTKASEKQLLQRTHTNLIATAQIVK